MFCIPSLHCGQSIVTPDQATWTMSPQPYIQIALVAIFSLSRLMIRSFYKKNTITIVNNCETIVTKCRGHAIAKRLLKYAVGMQLWNSAFGISGPGIMVYGWRFRLILLWDRFHGWVCNSKPWTVNDKCACNPKLQTINVNKRRLATDGDTVRKLPGVKDLGFWGFKVYGLG